MKQKAVLVVLAIVGSTMFSYAQNKKEAVALNWLTTHQARLSIQSNHSFEMLFSKKSIAGETFRYYQMIHGVQVYDSEVVIHVSNNNQVTFNQSTYDKTVADINTNPSISESDAEDIAISALGIEGTVTQKDTKLYVYNKLGATKLVYRIATVSKTLNGYWETLVDAQTGTVLSSKDVALYHKGKKKDKKKKSNSRVARATGTAMVFDPDPLTTTLNVYGGQYVDASDATNAALNAARTPVTLLDIEFSGGSYRLRGPYAEIAELQNPNEGLFIQSSSDFSFTRDQQGFEAANVYYHIDKSLRYINNSLNIPLVSLYNGGVVRFDAHSLNGEDQSTYGGGNLNFGEGDVDDAEDADVILHELGHGLHDWLTNGSLSQVNGLSEGTGDYWANSYKRSLGKWQPSDASYYYVFGWDGHGAPDTWPGRVTNYGAQYPGGLTGSIHTDGQMWATTLMEIWEDIGREKTDKALLLGLAMTNSGTNQEQAAVAVRQAAIDMGTAQGFTCSDIQAITNRFTAQGYSLPAYTCSLSVDTFETASISIFPNPTNGRLTFMNLTQEHEIAVFNMLGQRVQEQTVNTSENTLDVSQLATGTYFIKFSEADTILKFVKE